MSLTCRNALARTSALTAHGLDCCNGRQMR
jgi:hypothetical protein